MDTAKISEPISCDKSRSAQRNIFQLTLALRLLGIPLARQGATAAPSRIASRTVVDVPVDEFDDDEA